jgi:hypothetical protein
MVIAFSCLGSFRIFEHTNHLIQFAVDFARVLILTQSDKRRVAQVAVRRPLGKIDLGDELGFEPHAIFHLLAHQCPRRARFSGRLATGKRQSLRI